MPHLLLIPFFFAFGACVGSFLNVVVWRLPRIEIKETDNTFRALMRTIEGLSNPPSHCPKCQTPIRWYDNVPVLGWLKLRGRCRTCGQPISIKYPTIEFITGAIFVFYYVMFFVYQVGPCAARPTMVPHETLGTLKLLAAPLEFRTAWPVYLLYMATVAALLAASLIDAELFMIPIEIPWAIAAMGIIVHTVMDTPSMPGSLNLLPLTAALSAGGVVGLIVTGLLWWRGIIPVSFPQGEPMLDVEQEPAAGAEPGGFPVGHAHDAASAKDVSVTTAEPNPPPMTRRELNRELRKEMAFLLPPMLCAAAFYFLVARVPAVGQAWGAVVEHNWVSGLLGALLGAMVGGFVVWITRILGTLVFGRLAMGLGDVHLMFGVGAVVGAGCATIAFFLAPFFGISLAVWMFFTGKKRELPYGPYLSLATAFCLLFCCPISAYLRPGFLGLALMIQQMLGISTG